MSIITETKLPYNIFKKGKVRDVYEVDDYLLLIVTDRISAFDWVLKDPIPNKGICLTQITRFWFDYFKNMVDSHLVSSDLDSYPKELRIHEDQLYGRSMLVKKANVFPVECIVRGYISGSAWESYKKDGEVCGINLPSGLKESDRFDEPLFTPSTKAEEGHDTNISFSEMKDLIGSKNAEKLRDLSLEIYKSAAEYAENKGIIIADTKFEFGLFDEEIILVDELLTPDSSRFWPADKYEPGRSQSSFDKQYLRDYLSNTGWDKNSKPPRIPKNVILETQKKYQESYEKITGEKFHFNHMSKNFA